MTRFLNLPETLGENLDGLNLMFRGFDDELLIKASRLNQGIKPEPYTGLVEIYYTSDEQ